MKNNQKIAEVFLSIILIILLILLINPTKFWMPNEFEMYLVLGLVVAFLALTAFILREKAQDEREEAHRKEAGRIAFLTGSGIALLGIVIQSLNHNLDNWLILTLGGMVIAKLATRLYADIHR